MRARSPLESFEAHLARVFGVSGGSVGDDPETPDDSPLPPGLILVERPDERIRDAYRDARRQVPTRDGNKIILIRKPEVLLETSDKVVPLVTVRLMDMDRLVSTYVAANLNRKLEQMIRHEWRHQNGATAQAKVEPTPDGFLF